MMDSQELRDFCLSKPAVTEDMPFDEHVLAFRVGGKIFALTNLSQEEFSVNLKAPPELITEWRELHPESVQPGYHMNKKHWNTVYPNRGLNREMFFEMVGTSYKAVLSKLPAKVRKEITGD